MTMVVELQSVEGLRKSFRGQLLSGADAGYEDARRVQNGLIDRRPALIARCLGASDVVGAVEFARAHGLDIAVRGGGHGVAGRAVCDGGLMIDLSLMKRIEVDAKARTARAEAGLTWGEYNQVTQAHGLASTGGVVSTTGIAGLTLGGGLGWLMGAYGMAIDNLVGAEVVTADREVVRANDRENPDLFWALRGGGGNFGVVSSFEFALHPVGPVVLSGLVAHPLGSALDVLRFAREFAAGAPDELTIECAFLRGPDGLPLVAVAVCHCGGLDEAEDDVRALHAFGAPVMDTIGHQTYEATNTAMDGAFPKGALNYWKSSFLRDDLSDSAIETLADRFAVCPSPMTLVVLEHVHGAATRVPVTATAFPHRRVGWNVLLLSQWRDRADSDVNIAWTRETFDLLAPVRAAASYVNYQADDITAGEASEAIWGPNYDRLLRIKREYDPHNVFHLNQNIAP
jgi:FAD/FMN-containing dehydrogenase